MKTNRIIACLSLAFILTLSTNAQAFGTQCLYKQHPLNPYGAMTKTWGTVTTWTAGEALYYDRLELYMSFMRYVPTWGQTGSTTKTYYNYESVPSLEAWFVGVNNSTEHWAVWPVAIVVLTGENLPEFDLFEYCGPTGEERIIL